VRFQGDVVVCERGTGSVVRLSAAEPTTRTVLASGLGLPAGLAATGQDLWVSDWATGRVLEVVAGGRVHKRPRVLAEGLAYPEGLAVCADGSLLVVEAEAGRLTRIDPRSGKVTTVWDGLAPCLQGDHPTWIFNGVAVDASGTIYLTSDAANARGRRLGFHRGHPSHGLIGGRGPDKSHARG
jgi:sugar lactone lactonase YvrE